MNFQNWSYWKYHQKRNLLSLLSLMCLMFEEKSWMLHLCCRNLMIFERNCLLLLMRAQHCYLGSYCYQEMSLM